jgi:hypothetical protein
VLTALGPGAMAGAAPIAQPSYIQLDVGGVNYTTLLGTLTKHPDSMLATMFRHARDEGTEPDSGHTFTLARNSESVPAGHGRAHSSSMVPCGKMLRQNATDLTGHPGDSGAYILDRDGLSFRYVLNYLRNESDLPIPLPSNPVERQQLAIEAEYFMLDELLDLCRSTPSAAGSTGCALHPMTQSELLLQPRIEWARQLPPTDLRGVSIAFQNYDSSVLRECDLRGVDMRECTLSRCQLQVLASCTGVPTPFSAPNWQYDEWAPVRHLWQAPRLCVPVNCVYGGFVACRAPRPHLHYKTPYSA